MKKYKIINKMDGQVMGIYEGVEPQDALDAMAREAGCRDFAHSLELTDGGLHLVADLEVIDLNPVQCWPLQIILKA